jgi:N-acetylglucosaminyldiphosphoundecaprenol N-acetyl-beta-D-mannosaminyltransferase
MPNNKRIRILGIPVNLVDEEEAMSIFRELMKTENCSLIVTPNSEIIVNATKDEELKRIVEFADLVIPDGIGLVYSSKIMGMPLKERVTGIDFLGKILGYLEEQGLSVFFLGSKPGNDNSAGIAELAAENIKKTYKNLIVAGSRFLSSCSYYIDFIIHDTC